VITGAATAGLLALLGLIHLYWAARGIKGRSVALPERDGRPVMQPSRASTMAVAGCLFGGALVLLTRLGLVPLPVPALWPCRASWLLAFLFALRAIGEFRYVGIFKRVKGTPFARWDSALFTPLCIVIAVGSALVAAAGPRSTVTARRGWPGTSASGDSAPRRSAAPGW
jgi:hypothetical protein